MIKYWFFIAILSLMLASCGGATTEGALDNAKQTELPANNEVGNEVAALWMSYLKVSDALVAGDNTEAGKWALVIHLAAENFPMGSLNEEEMLRWSRQRKELMQDAYAISSSDIEAQRAAFESLSKTMYQVLTELGMPKGTQVYQQHCPMAFDNRGAWWLSGQPEIVNPYFGDKMLHCGRLQESISFN